MSLSFCLFVLPFMVNKDEYITACHVKQAYFLESKAIKNETIT